MTRSAVPGGDPYPCTFPFSLSSLLHSTLLSPLHCPPSPSSLFSLSLLLALTQVETVLYTMTCRSAFWWGSGNTAEGQWAWERAVGLGCRWLVSSPSWFPKRVLDKVPPQICFLSFIKSSRILVLKVSNLLRPNWLGYYYYLFALLLDLWTGCWAVQGKERSYLNGTKERPIPHSLCPQSSDEYNLWLLTSISNCGNPASPQCPP